MESDPDNKEEPTPSTVSLVLNFSSLIKKFSNFSSNSTQKAGIPALPEVWVVEVEEETNESKM